MRRLPTVIQATGLGRSTIYRLVADGAFPPPVHLGPRAVAWRWSDLDRWSESRRIDARSMIGSHARILAHADPTYFDLGLCGPLRTDLRDRADYCGLFKTPSPRNVATRSVFFHNGAFHRLEDAVRFYAERDMHPEKFYARLAGGAVRKYDDLPAAFVGNVNVEAPFNRRAGDRPALSRAEIRDIVAFLRTLNDGYVTPAR